MSDGIGVVSDNGDERETLNLKPLTGSVMWRSFTQSASRSRHTEPCYCWHDASVCQVLGCSFDTIQSWILIGNDQSFVAFIRFPWR